MDDYSSQVRTIYSRKQKGSKIPQVLNSQRVLVEPRSSAEKHGSRSSGNRKNHDHGSISSTPRRDHGNNSSVYRKPHDLNSGQNHDPTRGLSSSHGKIQEISSDHLPERGHGYSSAQSLRSDRTIRGGIPKAGIQRPPAVPPRVSQLRSNVYAGGCSSSIDDHEATSRSKSTFVPRIPQLSPNSFSVAWRKEEEERKIQSGHVDVLRRRDWTQVEFPRPVSEEIQPKHEVLTVPPTPTVLEDQRLTPAAPKITKREAAPCPTVPKRQSRPESGIAERQHEPEPVILKPQPAPELTTSKPEPAPEPSIEERQSTPEPEVATEPESSESSPVISQSTSGESISSLVVKDRDILLDLFRVQDLQAVDTSRFKMDPLGGKDFYTIKTDNVVKFRLNQTAIQSNLETFVMTPVPMAFGVKCRITRNKRGLDRNVFPNYHIHLELNDGRRILIMTARKRKKSKTSNYLISIDPTNLTRHGDAYVGKVRSNLMGTQFTIYDNGSSPKHFNYHSKSRAHDAWNYREELGTIIYEANVLGLKGPRKMQVFIPSMMNEFQRLEIRPEGLQGSMTELLKRDELKGITELRNKPPIWDQKCQAYTLNFNGRVSLASVKNFQIIHEENEKYIILQFGRIDEDHFTLDFRYPFCPLQAFAIALTSFDNKFGCE